MNRKYILLTVTLYFLSCLCTYGFAFNGKRKGFILGGGLGTGLTSFTQTVEIMNVETTSDRENRLPLVTSFVIGAGINNKFMLYYYNKVSWFSIENVLGDDVVISSGVGGLGITYYLEPKAPSVFIVGGAGASSWSAPFESDTDYWWGPGFMLGAGYEFSPHWSIEADVALGWPSYEEGGTAARSNVFSLMVAFNGLAY